MKKLTPEEEADLTAELQRLIKEKELKVELIDKRTGPSPKACPGCIACTCMICV